MSYLNKAVWSGILWIAVLSLGNHQIAAAQSLQITSPIDGAIISPGSTVTAIVTSSAAFAQVLLAGPDPIGLAISHSSSSPFQFTLQIPMQLAFGPYTLVAVGIAADGSITTSNPITIDVERADAPLSIQVQPARIAINGDSTSGFTVTGIFSDGSQVNLSRSSQTVYASQDQSVVAVSADGVVTAVSPGSTQIVVDGQFLIPVTVNQPVFLVPLSATLGPTDTKIFTGRVMANPNAQIIWSVTPAGLGSVTSEGVYTAPSAVATSQVATISATNALDTTQSAAATITLIPQGTLFTSSGSASPNPVNAGQGMTISATVNDTANSLSNGNIQILVYDPIGNLAAYQNYLGENFSSGQSHTYSMPFTAASVGTYTVRLGVFDSNWNLLYWNNLLASVSTNAGIGFTSSGSASPNPVNAGQGTTISATVNDTGNSLSNGNVQILVYDSSGNSAGYQNYLGENFSSGQSHTYSMPFTPASPGTYTVRLGVFDSNWNFLYWNDSLASVSADAGISFTSSATAQPLTVSRGSSTNISFTVTDSGGSALSNANVEIQIFDSSWSSVLVQNWAGQNFSASHSLSYSYSWNVASSLAPGTYYVAVAVYDSAWSNNYWNNDATITIQ